MAFGRTSAFLSGALSTSLSAILANVSITAKKWLPKLFAVRLIDREIGPGTVQDALRPPRHGVPKTPWPPQRP
jgi:hypothetical protein